MRRYREEEETGPASGPGRGRSGRCSRPTGRSRTPFACRGRRRSSTAHTGPERAGSERPLLTGPARTGEVRSRSTSAQTPGLTHTGSDVTGSHSDEAPDSQWQNIKYTTRVLIFLVSSIFYFTFTVFTSSFHVSTRDDLMMKFMMVTKYSTSQTQEQNVNVVIVSCSICTCTCTLSSCEL